MSQANSAIHGPYRRKVTLACGSCRKRRVKCSGSQPCTLCSESGRECEYDSKNRARRGPRPRRNAQSQRVIHQLAARIPSCEKAPLSSQLQLTADSVWHPQEEIQYAGTIERCVTEETTDVNDDINNDDDEDEPAPDPSAWKPGLEALLYNNDTTSTVLPALDIDLMCHLIHTFCTRANAQLRSLLSPSQIQYQLSQGTMSRALVLAVCASSMRFTVHRAAKGPQAREFAEAMEREARKCIQTSSVGWHQVNNVKTLCVLVDYMASYGHGRQAWMDIAMGRSLLQLAKSDCELEMEQTQALTIAERYLTIAQASHCLGHRHLQPSHSRQTKRPRLECAPCPEDCPHLVELLEVLACIHQLCLVPFREQNPLPWTPDSEFRALQDELEEYLLRHPSTFRFGSNSPSAQPSRLGDLDASISSIIWHCCVIVLNRNFLPIPERRPNPAADGALYPPARSLDFPEAPPLFLKERIYRCESSADAICDISQDIIRNGGFYSHALFVGYACTQSALVSINRIHRSPKPYDGRIVDNLKLAFVILGALQPFYTPAQEWMNLLFRAHDTNYASEISDHSFDNYFSRFLNIEEPTFMPLQPKTSDTTSEDNEGDGEHGRTKHVQNEEEERADETVPANSAPEWLQAYAGHLSGDIESDDEESPDESPRSSGVHIGPIPTQGTNAMTQMVPLDNPGEGQDRMNMGMGGGTSEILPVHMAGAILTSMSGGAPSFPLHAQEHRHQQLVHTEYDEQCMAMDNQTEFPGLFSQMPTFADFSELGPEIPIFPGLESVVGESDMWSDIFHNNMFE